MNNSPSDINDLYKEIEQKKKYTHKELNHMAEKVFALKKKYIENDKEYKVLQHMHEILHHERKKMDSLKMTIISALGTIFLPLGFIVGYFGMNFKSMGSPSLSTGVFSTKHVEKFIAGLSILMVILVVAIYKLHF